MSHGFYRETTPTGRGLFGEESGLECPNGGMSSGAVHQAGSQRVTVANLMHPWPTINMDRDEGGVLPLVEDQEI
jgi:hypothetical protein